MEAAAKKVQLLAQRILPDRPHHLSVSPDQRYRVPPDHAKVFEEFKHQRLQYMTLLSDADRGLLLTRPYYDMREEPPIPAAIKDTNAKMEKKVVTKLSLSDYKNKQKKVSVSPPDSGATPRTDIPRKEKEAMDGRIDRELKRPDTQRSRETDAPKDIRAQKQREPPNDERTSRPETKSKVAQDSNDTPDKRKRAPDADGELRPQKRPKPEASTPLDERSRTPRDDTPRRKDLHASQDKTPQKEGKSITASSTLPNGRSALKAALGSSANKSPVSRARGDSINGSRPNSPTSSKRPQIVLKEEDEDRKDLKDKIKDKPRRFMVTLKYSRKISKTVQRLLALPPKKDVIKKERSASIEPLAPPQARKRPISSTENVGDSIAVKRPRMSDITSSSKLATPSTPAKAATSMSRVASSNSVNTPGDGSGLTPAAPPSSDRDRPQTRDDSREATNPAKVQALRDRYNQLSKLGTKLKHERDMLLDRRNGDRGAHASDMDSKLVVMLGFESALAFMLSFRAVFESRRLENKAQDPKQWGSILGLLHAMRHDVRKSKPLEALSWQLQGVIHEEMIKCYWSLDPATHAGQVLGAERGRSNVWKSAWDAAERVEVSAMRTIMGPWTSVEDAVTSALKIMRRWTQEENVAWRAEVTVSIANGASS
ncbi:hypothetical protein CCHL11_01517 [Colletotrichum chlorophyti]|uniref:Uncharacterized protein n=1 Tax=Colletotrichum chlorophyti TaxID=708187 RepID=A0A1Q8RY06_9PEZI|nr:hypothetical protein CCHL11_01517 [Colletotrichum chlorophyti]